MSRRNLKDALEGRLRARNVVEGQEIVHGLKGDPPGNPRVSQECLDLRGEAEATVVPLIEQGFDPVVVSQEEEATLPGVPDAHGEHPIEFAHHLHPQLLVEMEKNLRVRPGTNDVPSAGKIVSIGEFPEVVDGPIVYDVDGPILVGHGLSAGPGKIDHRQPAMSECSQSVRPGPPVVGTPMGHGVGHSVQQASIGVRRL